MGVFPNPAGATLWPYVGGQGYSLVNGQKAAEQNTPAFNTLAEFGGKEILKKEGI